MLSYDDSLPLFSIHLFKTAGVSLHQILKEWFGQGFIHHKYDPATMKVRRHKLRRRNWLFKPVPVCVHGHFEANVGMGIKDLYPDFRQCITFLRDPLEQHISAYHFTRRLFDEKKFFAKGKLVTQYPYQDIDYFLTHHHSSLLNDLPWAFRSDNYKQIINDNFVHVGITDNFNASVNNLASILGKKVPQKLPVKNKTSRRFIPSEAAVDSFQERHQLEYQIYNYCKAMNQ